MSIVTTGTEEQVFTAIRSFLLTMFPDLTEVVQGLDNWVPMPAEESACMTTINTQRLGMGSINYLRDGDAPETGTTDHAQPSNLIVQVDFFGDGSRDKAVAVQAVWAKPWCFDQFPDGIKPISCKPPVPLSFNSEGKVVVRRCEIDLEIQYIPKVSVPQEFAVELSQPTSNPE
jgi:hypothetical protein